MMTYDHFPKGQKLVIYQTFTNILTELNGYKNTDPGHYTTYPFHTGHEMLIQYMGPLHLYGICICHRHV